MRFHRFLKGLRCCRCARYAAGGYREVRAGTRRGKRSRSFFRLGCQFGSIEVIDTVLKRYGGFAPFERLSFSMISELIDMACEKRQDELLLLRWIVGGYERNVAFSDFRAACTAVPAVSKSAEQIHTEMSEKFERFNFVKMGG